MIKFKVVSDSMLPLIKIGDELLTKSIDEELKSFDIILFKRQNKLVVHYIWRDQKTFNNTVITRSLKNIFSDEEPVEYNEIIGKVTNFEINFFLRAKIVLMCCLRGAL